MPVVEKTTCDGKFWDLKPNLLHPQGLYLLYVTKKNLHRPHTTCLFFTIFFSATPIYLLTLLLGIVNRQGSTLDPLTKNQPLFHNFRRKSYLLMLLPKLTTHRKRLLYLSCHQGFHVFFAAF